MKKGKLRNKIPQLKKFGRYVIGIEVEKQKVEVDSV